MILYAVACAAMQSPDIVTAHRAMWAEVLAETLAEIHREMGVDWARDLPNLSVRAIHTPERMAAFFLTHDCDLDPADA